MYNYWVLDLDVSSQATGSSHTNASSNNAVIVKSGYLLRNVSIDGQTLRLVGDINSTTPIEVIGSPAGVSMMTFNGEYIKSTQGNQGVLLGEVIFDPPNMALPNLVELDWKFIDSLPEIQPIYNDTLWRSAILKTSENPRNLTTPMSLYGSDYGFNTGNLLFRGQFVTTGRETSLTLRILGGLAFGYSVWLNETFMGSWNGVGSDQDYNQTLSVPTLPAGQTAILTLLQDTMGLDEDNKVGTDQMKTPRGILSYSLADHDSSDISWRITGNFGGEDYQDKTRGPLNEGGLYAERQGYHLPNPPSGGWLSCKPTDGVSRAGVGFYTASFPLDMPQGYDVPLSFQFTNTTTNNTSHYRCQLYVNGYQFGKYGQYSIADLDIILAVLTRCFFQSTILALRLLFQSPQAS